MAIQNEWCQTMINITARSVYIMNHEFRRSGYKVRQEIISSPILLQVNPITH